MAIQKQKQSIFVLISVLFVVCSLSVLSVLAKIPSKVDGFLYENRQANTNSIVIEAFFDALCPDSRDSWPPLKRALKHYGDRVSMVVHPFPLPYHDNAFVASRALHIVNKLNSSATYHLLEMFFKHQEKFDTKQTYNMSRASIVDHIAKLAAKAVGSSSVSTVESSFKDRKTDLTTRTSFKYACLRGVYGTPFFFVNGFPLPDPDTDSTRDYDGWRSTIDPLVGA